MAVILRQQGLRHLPGPPARLGPAHRSQGLSPWVKPALGRGTVSPPRATPPHQSQTSPIQAQSHFTGGPRGQACAAPAAP